LKERLTIAADLSRSLRRSFSPARRLLRRFAAAGISGQSAAFCLLTLSALVLAPTGARTEPIETEHLFGFTIGSDVGDPGDREIEGSVTGRFAKGSGTYNAGSSTLSAEFVPLPNLRTEFTGVINSYGIAGVSGIADQNYNAFGGVSADIRYRFLNRDSAPVGFALGAEPHWGRADDITGAPGNSYGVDFVAAADWEVVPERVVAAFNLLYQPDTIRSNLTGTWSSESTAGATMAVMAQVRSGLFVGGEARYLRRYDGFTLDNFDGHAFFVGPTFYAKFSERAWMTIAWSVQVAGHTTATPGSLDLVNFERQQGRLLFGVSF
jgi:hypothetical protein